MLMRLGLRHVASYLKVPPARFHGDLQSFRAGHPTLTWTDAACPRSSLAAAAPEWPNTAGPTHEISHSRRRSSEGRIPAVIGESQASSSTSDA